MQWVVNMAAIRMVSNSVISSSLRLHAINITYVTDKTGLYLTNKKVRVNIGYRIKPLKEKYFG